MSISDFANLTPEQFESIFRQWKLRQDSIIQTQWEQARTLAWASLRPYSKKSLRPTDVFNLPWDNTVKAKQRITLSKQEREEQHREFEYYSKLWQ